MKEFMNRDFLLDNEPAKVLYHKYAKDMPIFDYDIIDNVDTMVSTYSFEMDIDIASGLLQKDEIKSALANFMGGL